MAIKRLVLELDEEMHRKVKTATADKGITMRTVLLELLKKWLDKNSE